MSDSIYSLSTSLGRLVRFWRIQKELSQEDMALALAASTRHVSRVETGSVHPSRDFILKVAEFLNLSDRDSCNLLIAGGYIPRTSAIDFNQDNYRWLRKALALNLKALDPYPAMITDGQNTILMCNKSWLGLFHDKLDLQHSLHVSDYFAVIMEAIGLIKNESVRINTLCSVALSLKQEALIRNEKILEGLINELENNGTLPSDWVEIGAQFNPRMSFPITFQINNEEHEFFHVINSVSSMGPVENGMEPLLMQVKLFPKNHNYDYSNLLAHDHFHESLYLNELHLN